MSDAPVRTAGANGPQTKAAEMYGVDVLLAIRVVAAVTQDGLMIERSGARPLLRDELIGALVQQMSLRTADASVAYLTELLRLIYRRNPKAATSEARLSIEDLLSYASIDDVVRALVERHIHGLSFKGLNALDEHLVETLHFPLFVDAEQRRRAIRTIECRNLFVHNRGVVNETFKKRVPDAPERVGDVIQPTVKSMESDTRFLLSWIFDLDVRAIEKFGLATSPRCPRRYPELDQALWAPFLSPKAD